MESARAGQEGTGREEVYSGLFLLHFLQPNLFFFLSFSFFFFLLLLLFCFRKTLCFPQTIIAIDNCIVTVVRRHHRGRCAQRSNPVAQTFLK